MCTRALQRAAPHAPSTTFFAKQLINRRNCYQRVLSLSWYYFCHRAIDFPSNVCGIVHKVCAARQYLYVYTTYIAAHPFSLT
jgi:hypothetical protein